MEQVPLNIVLVIQWVFPYPQNGICVRAKAHGCGLKLQHLIWWFGTGNPLGTRTSSCDIAIQVPQPEVFAILSHIQGLRERYELSFWHGQ